jgi:hypothetical protein
VKRNNRKRQHPYLTGHFQATPSGTGRGFAVSSVGQERTPKQKVGPMRFKMENGEKLLKKLVTYKNVNVLQKLRTPLADPLENSFL